MYMHVCVYIYIYIYNIHTCRYNMDASLKDPLRADLRPNPQLGKHAYICTYMRTSLFFSLSLYLSLSLYIYIYIYMYIYIYIYIHIYIYIYINIFIYTYSFQLREGAGSVRFVSIPDFSTIHRFGAFFGRNGRAPNPPSSFSTERLIT